MSTASHQLPGRPVHPPLVHAPIGGVVIAAVCDLVSTIGGSSHGWSHAWFKGGSYALIVGAAVLLLATIAGFIDRGRHTSAGSDDRAKVNRHAAVMLLMAAIWSLDLILRLGHYSSAQHTPALVLVLSLVALALATLGGELGGRLVYRRGIGVGPPAARKPRPAGAPEVTHGLAESGS